VSQISTTLRKRFNIINSSILFNVSNKAIDLYVFALKQFFLLNFRNTIVIAFLNCVNYIFYQKYLLNRERICFDVLLISLHITLFM